MNVTIDSIRTTPATRALWWFTLVVVVMGGLTMRLLTIDRGTPAIGTFVYFGLLAVLFALIVLPTSLLAAWFWQTVQRRSWRYFVERIDGDTQMRWIATIAAIVVTLAFVSASGRLPKWHVWMSASAVNALLVWRLFDVFLRVLREQSVRAIDEPEARIDLRNDLHRQVPTRSFERVDSLAQHKRSRSHVLVRFASDDRARREHWRQRPSELRYRQGR
jgi:hypothetical protein